MNPREALWHWLRERSESPLPSGQAGPGLRAPSAALLEALAAKVVAQQTALLAAEPTAQALVPAAIDRDWVGGPGGPGHAQAFFIRWPEALRTPIHAHPNRMLVVVLRGRLTIHNYSLVDGQPALPPTSIEELEPGQYTIGYSSQPGHLHFVHAIEATPGSLSFHFYGDDPALGARFDEPAR